MTTGETNINAKNMDKHNHNQRDNKRDTKEMDTITTKQRYSQLETKNKQRYKKARQT